MTGGRDETHTAMLKVFLLHTKAGHRSHLCLRSTSSTCVIEKLLAFGKTSCSELHMFFSLVQSRPVIVEVNTLASKRAELTGNEADCSKPLRNKKNRPECTCVFQLSPVARKSMNAMVTCSRLKFLLLLTPRIHVYVTSMH